MIDPRDDPIFLREVISKLRADLRDADAAICVALGAVRVVSSRQRPWNEHAERGVLGALLDGNASLTDVAELRPHDFHGDGHAVLFALFTATLEARELARGPLGRRDMRLLDGLLCEGRFPFVREARAALISLPLVDGTTVIEDVAIVRAFADWASTS